MDILNRLPQLLSSAPVRSSVLLAALLASAAAAASTDEIQVYTDDINAVGERGLELHVNTTPRGRSKPDYAGEIPPQHGMRVTPEFSWGITETLETGLYLPAMRDADGNYFLGGAKLRLKWVPQRAAEQGGWYFGANGEISNLTKKFSESRASTELRVMAGYRTRDWIIGFNPIFDWALSSGFRDSRPDTTYSWKAAHSVAEGVALGLEYYRDVGKLGRSPPIDQQDHVLYLALDVDRKPWVFNIGIGRGLTGGADAWTLKTIIDIPF